jgi:hypothetical protein
VRENGRICDPIVIEIDFLGMGRNRYIKRVDVVITMEICVT